ncbi:hypothetical protein [Streptomyces sp. Amel2xC10]|uniref:hypothetical protein n=1 Tax=Streptomyces sp. Amel2xC10 TaxID=1305826 RepID=UPI000A08EAB1|nr:hypothetical protein [Streptomyces sp. Amel2xC10]SME97870.1 hypothetical protein SAMN02745830_00939 [Streptomyces sp. Amel2xC10]
MIDSTTAPPAPADTRTERRRLIEAIRALRRLLDKRPAFEAADRRRLNREVRDRRRAEATEGRALQRIREKLAREERSLTRRLNGLDGRRDSQERRALAVLRRESVERALNSTHLKASELNGIGNGLIRDLGAHGIRTAADFKRVSWGKAPNGKGGEVLYIHRTRGGRVHINGIGEHRGRPLMEWRQAALARAEARAPHVLPPDERHRVAEIIEAERTRLRAELAQAPLTAEAARAEATRLHAEAVERLTAAEREAAGRAAERRAEFDAMAEQLVALQTELAAHMKRYGDVGRRARRAQSRALRPAPASPTSPADAAAPHASAVGPAAPGLRASLGWLLPIVGFGFVSVAGVGELGYETAPVWLRIVSRLLALAATTELLRLWIPRRRWRTAGAMPQGTGFQASGMFLSLGAAGVFAARESGVFLPACVAAVLAILLLLVGTGHRINPAQPAQGAAV